MHALSFVGCMSGYRRAPVVVGWHGQHTSEGGHEILCEERATDVPGGSTLSLLAYNSRHRGRWAATNRRIVWLLRGHMSLMQEEVRVS